MPVLDLALLQQLDAAWAAQGSPIVDYLAPGLSNEQMDEITASVGVRLPVEARLWWGWHDGVPWRTSGEATPERWLGPNIEFMPLRDAVADYLSDREIFAKIEGDPEASRPAAYFPITRNAGPILCDCSVPEGAPAPIFYTHSHGEPEDDLRRPAARSFGEMVTWWIEAIEHGGWRWHTDRKTWTVHPENLDPERVRSGLV